MSLQLLPVSWHCAIVADVSACVVPKQVNAFDADGCKGTFVRYRAYVGLWLTVCFSSLVTTFPAFASAMCFRCACRDLMNVPALSVMVSQDHSRTDGDGLI